MTKEETIKIMATLGAFYSGGKNDPKAQANAWHLILKDYRYDMAMQAVMRFAKNDFREYATFPTVGNIVKEIEAINNEIMKPIKAIILGLNYGTPYNTLIAEAQKIISEDRYNNYLKLEPAEELPKALPALKAGLMQMQGLLEAGNDRT